MRAIELGAWRHVGNAPVTVYDQIFVAARVQQVWKVLSDPSSWPQLDATVSDVRLEGPVAVGTWFTWRSGRVRVASQFVVVQPGHELSWTSRTVGSAVLHRHLLSHAGSERTRLVSAQSISRPVVVTRSSSVRLGSRLGAWLAAIATAAEAEPAVAEAHDQPGGRRVISSTAPDRLSVERRTPSTRRS